MASDFKNYVIGKGKVIISLEKAIYTKGMIEGAKEALSGECKAGIKNCKDAYEITLTPKSKKADLEEMAVLFNDALISNFTLFPVS
ncbi:MAG: hypothetical protein HY811_00165 [Planctomycetes bacterium]|nr:hypothetical protein [Planctomycetota bacterium]